MDPKSILKTTHRRLRIEKIAGLSGLLLLCYSITFLSLQGSYEGLLSSWVFSLRPVIYLALLIVTIFTIYYLIKILSRHSLSSSANFLDEELDCQNRFSSLVEIEQQAKNPNEANAINSFIEKQILFIQEQDGNWKVPQIKLITIIILILPILFYMLGSFWINKKVFENEIIYLNENKQIIDNLQDKIIDAEKDLTENEEQKAKELLDALKSHATNSPSVSEKINDLDEMLSNSDNLELKRQSPEDIAPAPTQTPTPKENKEKKEGQSSAKENQKERQEGKEDKESKEGQGENQNGKTDKQDEKEGEKEQESKTSQSKEDKGKGDSGEKKDDKTDIQNSQSEKGNGSGQEKSGDAQNNSPGKGKEEKPDPNGEKSEEQGNTSSEKQEGENKQEQKGKEQDKKQSGKTGKEGADSNSPNGDKDSKAKEELKKTVSEMKEKAEAQKQKDKGQNSSKDSSENKSSEEKKQDQESKNQGQGKESQNQKGKEKGKDKEDKKAPQDSKSGDGGGADQKENPQNSKGDKGSNQPNTSEKNQESKDLQDNPKDGSSKGPPPVGTEGESAKGNGDEPGDPLDTSKSTLEEMKIEGEDSLDNARGNKAGVKEQKEASGEAQESIDLDSFKKPEIDNTNSKQRVPLEYRDKIR